MASGFLPWAEWATWIVWKRPAARKSGGRTFRRKWKAEVNPVGGGPKKLGWGYTWSPLVEGEMLLCLPGGPKGTLAALDKRNGDVLWRNADVTDQGRYTSPIVAEIGGVRRYVSR